MAAGLWASGAVFLENRDLAEGRVAGWDWPWVGWGESPGPRPTSVTPQEYGLGQGLLPLGKRMLFILGSAEEPLDNGVKPGRAACLNAEGSSAGGREPRAARRMAGTWDVASAGPGTTFF